MANKNKPSKTSAAANSMIFTNVHGTSFKPLSVACCPKSPSGLHHWNIEPPGGATSKGRCRYCGLEQVFANSIEHIFGKGK